jgi:hypothetical protein
MRGESCGMQQRKKPGRQVGWIMQKLETKGGAVIEYRSRQTGQQRSKANDGCRVGRPDRQVTNKYAAAKLVAFGSKHVGT